MFGCHTFSRFFIFFCIFHKIFFSSAELAEGTRLGLGFSNILFYLYDEEWTFDRHCYVESVSDHRIGSSWPRSCFCLKRMEWRKRNTIESKSKIKCHARPGQATSNRNGNITVTAAHTIKIRKYTISSVWKSLVSQKMAERTFSIKWSKYCKKGEGQDMGWEDKKRQDKAQIATIHYSHIFFPAPQQQKQTIKEKVHRL